MIELSEIDVFKKSLGKSHVLYTLIEEHEIILRLLDELERLNNYIYKTELFENAGNEIDALNVIINKIIDAEPHHQREERILFTELEQRGLSGPPKMMKWEHHELRNYKHEIKEFAQDIKRENFPDRKKDINFAVQQLVSILREHISKENNILYPMSVKFIPEKSKWEEMKLSCDEIGYCSFTPVSHI